MVSGYVQVLMLLFQSPDRGPEAERRLSFCSSDEVNAHCGICLQHNLVWYCNIFESVYWTGLPVVNVS